MSSFLFRQFAGTLNLTTAFAVHTQRMATLCHPKKTHVPSEPGLCQVAKGPLPPLLLLLRYHRCSLVLSNQNQNHLSAEN